MIVDFPVWPVVELMSVSEIEDYAPLIPCELDDDATLADALAIPGGLSIFCHRERQRNEKAGLTGVNHPIKRSYKHVSN